MNVEYGPESVGGDSPLLLIHARRVSYMLQDVWRDDGTASRTGMAMITSRHLESGVVWSDCRKQVDVAWWFGDEVYSGSDGVYGGARVVIYLDVSERAKGE